MAALCRHHHRCRHGVAWLLPVAVAHLGWLPAHGRMQATVRHEKPHALGSHRPRLSPTLIMRLPRLVARAETSNPLLSDRRLAVARNAVRSRGFFPHPARTTLLDHPSCAISPTIPT